MIEIVKFGIESLMFQNRPLNGAQSILDIKILCFLHESLVALNDLTILLSSLFIVMNRS